MAKKRVIRCLTVILTVVLAAGVEMFWLSRQKTVKEYKESQAAFVKLVAVFRQFQQGCFPNAVQLFHGPDGGGEGFHALEFRAAVAECHLLAGVKLAGVE